MGHSADLRAAAISCFDRSGHDKVKAAQLMREECGASCPGHTTRFIETCARRYQERHDLRDRRRPGRPHKVKPETAARLAQILERGREDGQPFFEIEEAMAADPRLEDEILESNATKRTIKNAVMSANHDLLHKTVDIKPLLTPQQLQGRRDAAARLLSSSAKKLNWTVFVDEASCEVAPLKRRKVWSVRGKLAPPITDKLKNIYKPMKLKWMGAVMHGVGAVSFQFLTGTTGFESPYKV